ncbi:hypothetical protein [Clostridium hydrogenum]|uniref:hypothetical protein n=1 Tax=Clostridium hydrogenum TaxID=2855764 RepID=UPI001F218028|nr:hypothetical protein [Clostridium hydrogenum]
MISEENLNKMFNGADNIPKEKAIKKAVENYKISEKTATSYYYTWKGKYMKDNNKLNAPNVVQSNNHTEPKESPKEPKATLKLDIVGVNLKGENGTYKLCKNGLELVNEGQILAFENKQQWEDFKNEIDRAFEYGKSGKVF